MVGSPRRPGHCRPVGGLALQLLDELRRHAKGLEQWGGELAQLWEVADALAVELNRQSDEAVVGR